MEVLASFIPAWLGTPLQAVSTATLLAILGILARVYLGKGELGIKAQQVSIEADKIEADIEAKLREHFSSELTRLTNEIERITGEHNETRDRQAACESREERLRRRVRDLENKDRERDKEVEGLYRVISFNSSALLLDNDGRPSEAVKDAAIRVLESLAKGERPLPDQEQTDE